MSDESDLLQEWLRRHQGVMVDAAALADPAAIATRLGTLARTAAEKLPFDVEPTGFARLFRSLTPSGEDNG